ncbi:iron complex transport system ATP-binding protein [Methanofollis sp. W23]|uniref:heme ABC transporter ATP-binding protein n=1 Tax=Methanofollis sp. W23 TaxID=2817849 RepID=UPI001AE2AE11|nr:heme ABC transporter ATP-binding protein [Methanofollis sp. W23]MBP2146506.1 iron complex transport system ATP-binding protein [Methanofollis sp. W23]
MTTEMIRAEDLDVRYGDVQVLDAVSLAVNEGSFIGILGPNGCGKTTLIRTISRVINPAAGAVYVDGREIAGYSPRELATRLGAVPQETMVSFGFTVEEIVQMGRHPYLGRLSSMKEADYAVCQKAMDLTSTAHLADRLITEISGGERQRVLIARALAQQPRAMLLDEPTSHLDINHQIEVLSIIRGLTPEVTVVAVFHDLNLAAYFCDRLILMERAKIVAAGSPEEVLTDAHIRQVFGVPMMVRTHPLTGRPYLVPRYEPAPAPAPQDTAPLHVHVVCGGGTGAETMYALSSQGYRVTAGVLSANDSDCTTAEGLGIPVVKEPPFAPVSARSLDEYAALLEKVDAVVITEMPVGPGNIANLKVLGQSHGPKIFVLARDGSSLSSRDYTGGEATAIFSSLCHGGAVSVKDIPMLVAHLAALRKRGKR